MLRLISLVLLSASVLGQSRWSIAVGKDEVTGNPGVGFDPSRVVPRAGDYVWFHSLQGQHHIRQGVFGQPCQPLPGGFDSGLHTVPNGTVGNDGPSWIYQIEQTETPVYFYDAAGVQCRQGSVFCFNTDETNSTQACHLYKRQALDLGASEGVPTATRSGEVWSQTTTSRSTTATSSSSTTLSQAPSGAAASGSGAASSLQIVSGVAAAGILGAILL